jgi:predicted flavoprotein YhiN
MNRAAIIGAGPAGLMAAEQLGAAGIAVTVFERMPTVGRKFLMAGRGGLNLTHSEPFERFIARYGDAAPRLRPILEAFPPSALVAWAEGLGQGTFVGSSGRVFSAHHEGIAFAAGLAEASRRSRCRGADAAPMVWLGQRRRIAVS